MWFDVRAALAALETRDGRRGSHANHASHANRSDPFGQARGTETADTDDRLDAWEERAAIREHDGGQPRQEAEQDATAEFGANVIDLRAAAYSKH